MQLGLDADQHTCQWDCSANLIPGLLPELYVDFPDFPDSLRIYDGGAIWTNAPFLKLILGGTFIDGF